MYVPRTRKLISSCDVVFDESVSSALSYTSQPYSEAMVMCPEVTYILYAMSSKEQTGDVITFTQFEEGNILTETHNNEESCDESNRETLMMNEQYMENTDSNEKYEHDLVSTEMLEYICDGSQTHPTVNKREACYEIRDCIRRKGLQWKGALKATRNTGKGLHKVLSTTVKEILQELSNFGESGSEVSHFIP